MFRPRPASLARRRGIILLVVVSMLTLFAIVGISFVLYANSEATSSRVYREVEQPPAPNVDPELLLSYFLGQYMYGPVGENPPSNTRVPNPYSSIRGHDMMSNMFGYYTGATKSRTPYAGVGWLRSNGDYEHVDYQYRTSGP